MDAGVAAVVGAAIGGGLATITAIGTSWFQFRVTRMQNSALESEAARQRRFDSLRERREPRQRAYADFLEVAHRAASNRGNTEQLTRFNQDLLELIKLSAVVAVTGPEPVADAASAVVNSLTAWQLRSATRSATIDDSFNIHASIDLFIDEARGALENSGDEDQGAQRRP